MVEAVYQIVQHDGGWAYKLGDVFSETFQTRAEAHEAAEAAAAEQRLSGDDADIEYEDAKGAWHEEHSNADDRPSTSVKD
ncbi:MAG TPA: DUF2188 domain-containing protein [Hansschlegelia sp.]